MFEWDEEKSLRNLKRRGIDFKTATLIFDGPYKENLDDRFDYDEDRYIALVLSVTKFMLWCILSVGTCAGSSRHDRQPGERSMPTIVRMTREEIARNPGKIDHELQARLTDDDIRRQIAEDPDLAPELTAEDLKRGRLVRRDRIAGRSAPQASEQPQK